MKYHQETSDANFFSLVHHVLESNRLVTNADRRESDRHEFPCRQFIAPYVGGSLPKQTEFRLVRCQDLSPSGFSFLAAEPPDCEYLVVALGKCPYIFVSAHVVHCATQLIDREEPFVVGCRFVARIKGIVYGHHLGKPG
jgi:hypothetical protein